MDLSALTRPNSTSSAATAAADSQKSFRDADFMKIMLAEIAKQDPFKPQETSQIVDNMQKLQQLANSKFEKYRDDLRWAQDILGKDITAQQMSLTDAQAAHLKEKGIMADRGFNTVNGRVESYRVEGETVYVSIAGKHYSLDNVKQINPGSAVDSTQFGLASGLLGKTVAFYGDKVGDRGTGKVSSVSLRGADNQVVLQVGDKEIPFSHVDRISL
jgi:flagellar hook assembly protein FlgD